MPVKKEAVRGHHLNQRAAIEVNIKLTAVECNHAEVNKCAVKSMA
jgi:hypothetical protein